MEKQNKKAVQDESLELLKKKIDGREVGGKDEKTLNILQNEIYNEYLISTKTS